MENIRSAIRTIPDFPKPGIDFKDITPLLADAACFHDVIEQFRQRHQDRGIDMVVGIEARGFVFASALAYALRAGTCLVRKPGKLPYSVHQQEYQLEYGKDTIEIHTDALKPGQRILIFDDVLATGGTVSAVIRLIRAHFAIELIEVDFLMELQFLNGRMNLGVDLPVFSLLQY